MHYQQHSHLKTLNMIDLITYQEKQYPIRISHYTYLMTDKEMKARKDDYISEFEIQEIMLWYALEAGHHFIKKEFTLKREEVSFILDECMLEFRKYLRDSSKSVIENKDEIEKNADKKK